MIQKAFTILWGQHNRHQRVSMIHRRFGSYPSLGWTECLNSFRPPCCSLSSGSISWRKHSIWGLSVYVWRRWWQPTPLLLPGKSHGWRNLVGCSLWGREELDTTERLHFHFSLSCIGEGNSNPLQCSCLENPRNEGAWWAAIYGVTQSRTRLKRLSSSNLCLLRAIMIITKRILMPPNSSGFKPYLDLLLFIIICIH